MRLFARGQLAVLLLILPFFTAWASGGPGPISIQLTGDPVQGARSYAASLAPGAESEIAVTRTRTDRFGSTHVRLQQRYRGLPVVGSEMIAHVDKHNVLYLLRGQPVPNLRLSTDPALQPGEAVDSAVEYLAATGRVGTSLGTESMAQRLRHARIVLGLVDTPRLEIFFGVLAYSMALGNTEDHETWSCVVDAKTGDSLSIERLTRNSGPSIQGHSASISGCKLANEVNPATKDSVVSVTGWQDTVGARNYFLYYRGDSPSHRGPWSVYNDVAGDWEQQATSNWGTTDRAAVSLAKNLELVQRWLADSLGMFSFNDSGDTLKGHVHSTPANEGTANPRTGDITFGDGDQDTFYAIGVLDVVGHETGHCVTYHMSNLVVGSWESGGMDESYADILGESVEFWAQADSSAAYPNARRGTADWLFGEDAFRSLVAARDFRYPQRVRCGGTYAQLYEPKGASYCDGTFYWQDTGSGGVLQKDPHRLAPVQDFAFYLVAQGSAAVDSNDGHHYGAFSGIGVAAAAQVAMLGDIDYLDSWGTSLEQSRGAWMDAAQELVSSGAIPSYAVATVDSAWKACGVKSQEKLVNSGHHIMKLSSTNWDMKISGQTVSTHQTQASTTTGNVGFKKAGQSNVALQIVGTGVIGNWSCAGDTVTNRTSAFNADSLTGKLVFRYSDGTPFLAVGGNGDVKVRGKLRMYAF